MNYEEVIFRAYEMGLITAREARILLGIQSRLATLLAPVAE